MEEFFATNCDTFATLCDSRDFLGLKEALRTFWTFEQIYSKNDCR